MQAYNWTKLTLKVLNFWKFTSYCSLKPIWSGMGEVVSARTSPTLHPPSPPTVHQLSRLALLRVNVLGFACPVSHSSIYIHAFNNESPISCTTFSICWIQWNVLGSNAQAPPIASKWPLLKEKILVKFLHPHWVCHPLKPHVINSILLPCPLP